MTALRPPTGTFETPTFSNDLDVEGVIARIPASAQIKGFFVTSYERMLVEQRPELAHEIRAAMPRSRTGALHDCPRADVMRAEVELARLLYPGVTVREALRRATQRVYPTFLSSLFGRVLLATLGRNVDSVLGLGPRAMSAVTNYGAVAAERLGPAHWRYHYVDYYSWLDCGDVGVMEGLLQFYGKRPRLTLVMNGPFEMWLDIQWDDAAAPLR